MLLFMLLANTEGSLTRKFLLPLINTFAIFIYRVVSMYMTLYKRAGRVHLKNLFFLAFYSDLGLMARMVAFS